MHLLSAFMRGLYIATLANIVFICFGYIWNWPGLSLISLALLLPCLVSILLSRKNKFKHSVLLMSASYTLILLALPVYIGTLYTPILMYAGILIAGLAIFKSSQIRFIYFTGSFIGISLYILLSSYYSVKPPVSLLIIEAAQLFIVSLFYHQIAYVYLIQYKKELQEKESREFFLNQILDISPYCIFTKNPDGVYTFGNKYFIQSKLLEKQIAIGKKHHEIFSESEHTRKISKEEQNVIQTGEPVLDAIALLITKEGKKRWVQYSKVPMRNQIEQVTGILCIAKDITEQKMVLLTLEEEKVRYLEKSEELEKYIASNMQLENFAYLASHDLKEPVRSIVSFSQLLQNKAAEKLNAEEKEYLKFIISASKNMSTLIDDLLQYSLVDAMDQKITDFSPAKLLEVIILELSAQIDTNQATVKYDNLPDSIEADRTQIKQLFQNLISNALKFCNPDKPPVVIISGKTIGQFYQFSIADNGIGIAPKFYERIFLLFRRLHHKEDYEGTGIGLAICKKIVDQHHGKIWLESKIGQGTIFHFTIARNQKSPVENSTGQVI